MTLDNRKEPVLALFYCQNVPESAEADKQSLEERYGESIKLYPIPCSGRLEPLHLLKALEEFADAAYVLTCPEGACRYFEGNQRAKRRVEKAKKIIGSIGLEEERAGIIVGSKETKKTLGELAQEVRNRISNLPPSPVLQKIDPAAGSLENQPSPVLPAAASNAISPA